MPVVRQLHGEKGGTDLPWSRTNFRNDGEHMVYDLAANGGARGGVYHLTDMFPVIIFTLVYS